MQFDLPSHILNSNANRIWNVSMDICSNVFLFISLKVLIIDSLDIHLVQTAPSVDRVKSGFTAAV